MTNDKEYPKIKDLINVKLNDSNKQKFFINLRRNDKRHSSIGLFDSFEDISMKYQHCKVIQIYPGNGNYINVVLDLVFDILYDII